MEQPAGVPRIVYLALADARGHLMRAHLLRELLAPWGVEVEIITTSAAGRRFLAALGTPAEVVSSGFRVVYDARHNIQRRRTTAKTLLYMASPWGLWGDRRRLLAHGRGAAFVVSDSLHPALLLAPRRQRVVQVYGENIRRATFDYFGGRRSLTRRVHRAVLRRGLGRAFAQLEHTLEPQSEGDGETIRLPPIIPCPRPRPQTASPTSCATQAVVYLNPHFRDPAIAEAIEACVAERSLTLYGVAEGFADRDGWRAHDSRLVDQVATASVFITGAGMGGLGMARAFGVPTVCLVTHQPEQRANARQARADEGIAAISLPSPLPLRDQLCAAVDRVQAAATRCPAVDPSSAAQRIQQRWVNTFLGLIAQADPTRPKVH